MSKIIGVIPILATPFNKNCDINYKDYEKECEFLINADVNGIGLALGSEIFKLDFEEKERLIKTLYKSINQSKKNINIIVNTGTSNMNETIRLSKQAQYFGANALMVMPPNLITLNDSEIMQYYETISDNIPLPIVMQDIPGASLSNNLIVNLANNIEYCRYVKLEVSPTPLKIEGLLNLKPKDLIILGGASGNYYIEESLRGAKGTMPGSYIPDVFVKTYKLLKNNKWEEAYEYFNNYVPMLRYLSQGLSFSYYLSKYILCKRGIFESNNVRPPSINPNTQAYQEMDSFIKQLKLSNEK
jgi:4-hydroxy-tetrahydrodipicolinate synthase